MQTPGRKFAVESSYRYGFNGKEDDPESGLQDYGMRMYNPTVARFLSVDPISIEYPELTPFQFASNGPISNIDLDGLEAWAVNPSTGQVLSGPLNIAGLEQDGFVTGMYSTPIKAPQTQKRPVLQHVADATNCQGCPSRNIAMNTAPATARRQATVSQANGPSSIGVKKAESEKIDPYVRIIKQDLQQRESVRPGDEFPMIGSLVQGFRRLGNDDADGATSSFGRFGVETAASALPFVRFSRGSLNPNEIHFMQSSIKNTTGEFTVLGNAEALSAGTLNPNVLRINVWKDATGKIWTLDHRRLAAFRLSGLNKVPVNWASKSQVQSQMWKMTTKNGGTSIKLKFSDGTNQVVY
ncbi:hypothetical protein GCM10023184_06540 [Flaviaesturariibacter amylovorans]|uniref:RHS repeat-associated core domain-containing protein n=1 Tax=Flaviaesturariibacter amylovorans TaxID=1084520 RepID=A0ABP8GB45_9BACT